MTEKIKGKKATKVIEDEAKDVHTAVAEEMFGKGSLEPGELGVQVAGKRSGAMDPNLMGTRTGRLRSDQPNESNRPKADGPALQNIPIRTEEAKEIRDAFAKEVPPVGADYGEVERRVAAAMGLGNVEQVVMDAYDREKPYGGGLPAGMAILKDEAFVPGRGKKTRVASAPVGVVISRRQVVETALAKLGRDKLQVIANYKGVPAHGNHRMRRIKKALHRQIMKFLPKGITLDEAMAVLP